jgi:hypothetical protein
MVAVSYLVSFGIADVAHPPQLPACGAFVQDFVWKFCIFRSDLPKIRLVYRRTKVRGTKPTNEVVTVFNGDVIGTHRLGDEDTGEVEFMIFHVYPFL